jgi:hypothetical protein
MADSDFIVEVGERKFLLSPVSVRAESWCAQNLTSVPLLSGAYLISSVQHFAEVTNAIIREGMIVEESRAVAKDGPKFAKLSAFFQMPRPGSVYLFDVGWSEIFWVQAPCNATKLSLRLAELLREELKHRQPQSAYEIQRDENGEKDVPPHGQDNFVIRRAVAPTNV